MYITFLEHLPTKSSSKPTIEIINCWSIEICNKTSNNNRDCIQKHEFMFQFGSANWLPMICGWNWVTAVLLLSVLIRPLFSKMDVKLGKHSQWKALNVPSNQEHDKAEPSYFAAAGTFWPAAYFVACCSEGWGTGVKLCKVILPLSRCRMFQLWPPSVMAVVSGPGPDVNTAPVFVLTRPPQETSPIWLLCIPKYADPIAIDECRPLQSRANISALSGKTSETRSMFWIRLGRSVLMGSGRMWPICFGSRCLAVLGVFYLKCFAARRFLHSIAFMPFFCFSDLLPSLGGFMRTVLTYFLSFCA